MGRLLSIVILVSFTKYCSFVSTNVGSISRFFREIFKVRLDHCNGLFVFIMKSKDLVTDVLNHVQSRLIQNTFSTDLN